MRIIIYDTAVRKTSGGVFTILKQLYESASLDNNNEYIFVLGDKLFSDSRNIKIIVRKDLQESYIKRIIFEILFGKRYLLGLSPDVVLSMQNTAIFGLKNVKQFVYLHQPIPFQKNFHASFFIKNQRKLFFYQYIVGTFIKISLFLNKNITVIVQSNWLKNELVRFLIKKENDIVVSPPQLDSSIFIESIDSLHNSKMNLFYPSTAFLYKNHKIIIDSLKLLTDEQNEVINVFLTINSHEFKELVGEPVPNNVFLLGRIDHNKVLEIMSRSILVFPSKFESFGLPITEAKSMGRPTIINNIDVLRETVGNYNKVVYFDGDDPQSLANSILETMDAYGNSRTNYEIKKNEESNVMENIINLITK